MVNKYIIKKGTFLKNWLSDNHLGKQVINKLINLNAISTVSKVLKADDYLKPREEIYINYSLLEDNSLVDTIEVDSSDLKSISILYEDDEIIAVDKPSDILVHSDGVTSKTVLNIITKMYKDKMDDSFLRCIHRLDYSTSGVLVFAKNILSYCYLSFLMEERLIEKEYFAVVKGSILKDQTIKLHISKDRHNSKKMVGFIKEPTNAITNVYVLKDLKNVNQTLVKVIIFTGKPHQIRVSLAFINHPIINDELYQTKKANGKLMLLASRIKFELFNKVIEIKTKKDIFYLK